MELELNRETSSSHSTVGSLFADGIFECYTLEDVIREIDGEPVSSWKVPGKTAIPAGRYRVQLEHSPRFGADTMTLEAVPGFSCIRVHAGNTDEDTEGCVLVGEQVLEGRIVGGTSRPALEDLRAKVIAAIRDRGEDVWISIHNPE